MATIPMDVIHSCILPRLPAKSLIRFKPVSKSWQTIISSSDVIHIHHHHALTSDANRLIIFSKGLIFHIHELDTTLTPSLLCYYPQRTPVDVGILASSEFFLLINLYYSRLILLNPSTVRYYEIPYPSLEGTDECYGMYLDEANHDYKVVKIVQTFQTFKNYKNSIEVMVYSLRDNKWRLIEPRFDKLCDEGRALIRHLIHISVGTNAKKRIGCFDILAEKWTSDVRLPDLNDFKSIKLTVLDGLLCVTAFDTGVMGSRNYSVWVMKEYGDKDSWFKLINIAFNDTSYWDINPIAFRKGSQDEVLIRCYRFSRLEYFWYNVREKKGTTATIEGNYGFICKGSLVDFPGGRNMKLYQPKQRGRNY